MHTGKEPIITEIRVIPAATMVKRVAISIVFFLPRLSKRAPVIILPSPLQTASTPTKVVAKVALAPTESDKSRAKLITELPTAVAKASKANALQKEKRFSI